MYRSVLLTREVRFGTSRRDRLAVAKSFREFSTDPYVGGRRERGSSAARLSACSVTDEARERSAPVALSVLYSGRASVRRLGSGIFVSRSSGHLRRDEAKTRMRMPCCTCSRVFCRAAASTTVRRATSFALVVGRRLVAREAAGRGAEFAAVRCEVLGLGESLIGSRSPVPR